LPDKNSNQAEIEELKKNIFSGDLELVKSSRKRLGEIGGDEVVDFLIPMLMLDDQRIRNSAALTLRDIGDNKALEPLLAAIFKKENHNHNQTLVYALETLDCSEKLVEIFTILFYESYVGKISACNILNDQIFSFTEQDLLNIEMMWEDLKKHPEKGIPMNGETMADIQKLVDGYLSYLKPKE